MQTLFLMMLNQAKCKIKIPVYKICYMVYLWANRRHSIAFKFEAIAWKFVNDI